MDEEIIRTISVVAAIVRREEDLLGYAEEVECWIRDINLPDDDGGGSKKRDPQKTVVQMK